MQSIAEIVKQVKQNWTKELSVENMANEWLDSGLKWIDSMLNPVVTIQVFSQILNGKAACTDLRLLAQISFTAAGYCKSML
jgi:hypothetical protein